MSWDFRPQFDGDIAAKWRQSVTVPSMWLDAAVSDPADCPVCALADSAADCLAHWEEPTVPEVNAHIRATLASLRGRA